MQFRTELSLVPAERKISHAQNIMGFGSCFIDNIGEKLDHGKFRILNNPFGTVFHPLAIENALARILSLTYYSKEEIFKYGELYFSWDHHTSFSQISIEKTLDKINTALEEANEFIQKADCFILTFGTSWVYKIKEMDLFVANCHKVPAHNFNKILLNDAQIKSSLRNCFNYILDINPNAQIITTISPVRHTKEGLVENSLSKAKLIQSLHEVATSYPMVEYFPAYELMMDDLRDYRFYKKDLIHPNDMAVDYIWEKFSDQYFRPETLEKIKQAEKIHAALQHKPMNPNSMSYKEFLYKTTKQIEKIESNYPLHSFSNEKDQLKKMMNEVD